MSLIDDTFAAVPGPLLRQWGQDITYIKVSDELVYNPLTGYATLTESLITQQGDFLITQASEPLGAFTVSTDQPFSGDITISAKAIITRLNPRESEGLYQATDLKFIMSADELGTYYPSERDSIQYTEAGATRRAKVIAITSYRGDNPVLHTLIARPQ